MKARSVFEFRSYKKAIEYFLLKKGERGLLSRAAEALNCQPSFLSRVIRSEIHLTPEHAFLLARFLKFDSDEQSYFQTLVDYDRAGDQQYREFLARKLEQLREAHESKLKSSEKEDFIADQKALYFSSWINSAIHFLTAIPEFQNVESLSARLGLTKETTTLHLRQLEAMNFVRETKKGWVYAGGQFHLPKDSPFVVLHHQNWRSRAVLDAQNFNADGIHYTSVLTLSQADLRRLREVLLQFIAEAGQIAGPSEPEEGVALAIDLFRI